MTKLPTASLLDAYTMVVSTARAMANNLDQAASKIRAGTVTSSDIIDGLWDRENALLRWRGNLAGHEADIRSPTMRRFVRDLEGDPTIDLGAALDGLDTDISRLLDTIRAHPALFNTDGTENATIADQGGLRRSTVYRAGELDDLLPLIANVRRHLG